MRQHGDVSLSKTDSWSLQLIMGLKWFIGRGKHSESIRLKAVIVRPCDNAVQKML